jgi:hypothetical protein
VVRVLLGILLLVPLISASCRSVGSHFETKRQRAREAIEALEVSCLKPEEHGGGLALLKQQSSAKARVDSLDYEDQPVYRRRLNEAWEGCARYKRYQEVRRTLEPNGHLLTEAEIRHLSHKDAIEVEAAFEFLDGSKDRKWVGNMYPYPDD